MIRRSRSSRPRFNRGVLTSTAALPFTAMFVALAVTASSASWTDVEWDRASAGPGGAPIGALDCVVEEGEDAIGSTRGEGRLLGGELLGIDLDTLALVDGVEVVHDGDTVTADPATATVVPGTNGEGYADPLDVTALSLLNLQLGGLLKLPLDTEVGVVGQYARASNDLSSAASAGVITDSGAIDLEQFDDEETLGSERPRLGELALGNLLSAVVGDSLGNLVSGLADLTLNIGAVAASADLDGCGAAWSGEIYDHLDRDYAVAGLDLDVDAPLVGGLVTAVEGVLVGVEGAVNAIASDQSLLSGIIGAVGSLLATVLTGKASLGSETLSLSLTVDLSAARSLLDDTISDDANIVEIDLDSGIVRVDIAGLFGSVYGSDGLNGLAPNTQLLINDEVLAALEDALTDALSGWVADIIEAVEDALEIVKVSATLTVPLTLLGPDVLPVTPLKIQIDGGIKSLLDGTAEVDIDPPQIDDECGPLTFLLCGTVNLLLGVLLGLVGTVLTGVVSAVGAPILGALNLIGEGLSGVLDAALDAPVAAVLALLGNTLSFLFDEDSVLSILINAQNAPDPEDPRGTPGPEPSDWGAFAAEDRGPPYSTGRYDVDAVRITVLGVLGGLKVALDVAHASVGDNRVLTG